jgi:hypothetical protein
MYFHSVVCLSPLAWYRPSRPTYCVHIVFVICTAGLCGAEISPSVINVPNVSNTDITGYGISATSGEGIIGINTTTGIMTVALAGAYHVEARCTWDANTTGNRQLLIIGTSVTYTMDNNWQIASGALVGGATQVTTGIIFLGAGATVKANVYQNSGGTRTVGNANLKLVRL